MMRCRVYNLCHFACALRSLGLHPSNMNYPITQACLTGSAEHDILGIMHVISRYRQCKTRGLTVSE
ncbi:hypothetical protein BDW69DRAFT_161152 [Aspergillus filifer]